MPFRLDALQLRILGLLEQLEREGCPFVQVDERPSPVLIFDAGVPQILLQAWLTDSRDDSGRAVWALWKRQLIRSAWRPSWPYRESCKLQAPDGRVLHMRRALLAELTIASDRLTLLDSACVPTTQADGGRRPAVLQYHDAPMLSVAVLPSAPGGGQNRWIVKHCPSSGPLLFITPAGLQSLDESDGQPSVVSLVTLNQVAPLTGLSKRTLERHVRTGRLPAPDFRGGSGHSNKWLWETLRPALGRVSNRDLPTRFPGARII